MGFGFGDGGDVAHSLGSPRRTSGSFVREGVTVRGTVDVIIATRCLSEGFRLLHSDRDFDAFEEHLGLQVVDCAA